jgi:hypothetical protein
MRVSHAASFRYVPEASFPVIDKIPGLRPPLNFVDQRSVKVRISLEETCAPYFRG